MTAKRTIEAQFWITALSLLFVTMQTACEKQEDSESEETASDNEAALDTEGASDESLANSNRPEGWTDDSHGPDAVPNYDIVFNQEQVNRIDIKIDPSDWEAMLADMTEMSGEFGTGSRFSSGLGEGGSDAPSFEIPSDSFEACKDKAEDDPCSLEREQGTIPGKCGSTPFDERMVCIPDNMTQIITDLGIDTDEEFSIFTDENPIWVPCTVNFEGKVWYHVGIRFKGQSTLNQSWMTGTYKLPIKLDFDEFEEQFPEVLDQRFFGFKRLSFASNAMDDSYLRDKVTGDLFYEGGVPAPRRSFYRLFIDTGEGARYFGVYTMAEVPAKPMLVSQFGETGGNLYKPRLGRATWEPDKVIDESSFSKKTNELEPDFSDLENAIAALNASREDAATWRKNLEALFDTDGFMRWLAINTVIQDWDTYGNMSQNYYLYGDPAANGRLSWIPWDHNLSLSGGTEMGLGSPLPLDMSTVGDQWPLIRYLYDDPVYNKAYWKYVKEFVDGPFARERVKEQLQKEHDLIKDYILGPDGEQPDYTTLTSPEAFESSLQEIFAHIDKRHQDVQTALVENTE